MSAPVQTFLLEVEARESNYVVAAFKSKINGMERNNACPKTPGRLHRCEVAVPSGMSMSDVFTGADDTFYIQLPDRRVQMCCEGCGIPFKADESETWSSHAKWWYRNPKTGREGNMAYGVGSPGAVYESPWYLHDDDKPSSLLSDFYIQNWLGKRPPLTVVLPDGSHWCIDLKSSLPNGQTGWGPGWTITGDSLHLTASPSINCPRYHGFLQNGVLTPDLEGRTYPEQEI